MKKNVFNHLWMFVFGLACILLTACSNNVENRNAFEATSALVESNKNIVSFGYIGAKNILDKTGYQKIPKINVVLGNVVSKWGSGINLTEPIYYALEAPFDQQGNPKTAYAILNVKNQDSIKAVISEMGYALEKEKELTFYQENDVTFGMRNNLLYIIGKSGEYNGKEELLKLIEATEGDLSTGKANDILTQKADIVTGVSFERLLETSNTDLAKLDETKKKELKNLITDAYIQTTVQFLDGKLVVEAKNLFSEELKNTLFFKDKNGTTLIQKLGGGKPWMGLSANLDLRKAEDFLTTYLPESRKKINQLLPGEINFALMSLGEKPLAKLFSGQLGFVATGDAKSALGMEFQFAAFLGLGQKGDVIKSIVDEQLSAIGEKNGDTYTVFGTNKIKTTKEGIYVNSGVTETGKINLPSYIKRFGEDSFDFFIAFDQIDVASLELEDEMKVLEILKYFTIHIDREGTTIEVVSKNSQGNILKQVADFYKNQLLDEIGA